MTELEKLSLSQPLTDVYNAMEQDLMIAIAKQIARDGEISATSQWRLQRLAEAGDLDQTAIAIIASYTGIQSDLLTEALSRAANSVIDKLEPGFRELAKQGFISDTPVPASKSVNRAIQTFRKQAASDLNLVNTVMRYKAKQAYVDLVNKTYDAVNAIEDVSNRQELLNTLGKHTMSTVMGAESRSEAVRKCIKEFNNKGIPAFVDAAGREWSPEAYINMDIRTTVSNTANAAQDARCDDYGIDLIAVSSHMGARPKCAPYQGRVFSRSNKSGIAHDGNGKEIPYEPLSSTSYGEPDGLFGINCKHKKYPFIDGVNFQRYFPYDKEENDKRYKEIQEQRRLERQVRKTRTEADMLNEVGDTEGAKAARAKLKEQRKAYRTYCDDHDLTQRNDRLTVGKTSSGSRSNAGTSSGNVPKAPYAKAAEVNVPAPAPASSGKAYTGEKIVKPLDVNNYFEAKTIDEAQAYAKSIGVKYPDYSKFTLERANNMNMAISTLPDDAKPYVVTDLQKYTAVTGAPLDKRSKSGYACTVTPYEIDLKRAGIADVPRLSGSGNTIVAVNTRNYKTIDSVTESKLKSEELVVSSGRGKAYHFNTDGKATDFHECGHVYASKHGLPMAFSSDADRWYRETGCLLLQSPNEAWSEAYAAYYTHADDLPPYIRRYFDPGEWKTGSGSKVLSLDEWYKKVVDNSSRSSIINTGAISGALNPYSKEAAKHAAQYYESVRHMKTDTSKISAATGISQDKIDKIKNHVFIAEHDLLTGRERFAPSYDMAQSWQRLINGDYKEQDIVLLKHEYAELRYMEKGYTQNEAHILASKKYNYAKYCE